MYLKSLEVSGFKSFAKKTELLFASPITGIVGPNGSGKSNVAEAFRFVLGEQSLKSMRGKRGEDLIWNGTRELARQNLARVKVAFDNPRRVLDMDFDEVTLERIVHRDGVNEYFINSSQVRLKDVMELLAKAHIGSSGHHIISQGEADRVLSSTPRERREIIEDALGLKLYQWKRIESEKKLEKTRENMKSVESLRRELAPHLKYLSKQVEKLQKAEVMREELKALYLTYFAREDMYLKSEKAKIVRDRHEPSEKLKALEIELAQAKEKIAHAKASDEKSSELVSLEGQMRKAREEKDAVLRQSSRLEGMIEGESRRLAEVKKEAEREEDRMVRLSEIRTLEGEISALESEIESSTPRVLYEKVRGIVSGFITRHRSVVDESAFQKIQKDIERMNGERGYFEEKIKTLGEEEAKLAEAYQMLRSAIEQEKDSNRDAEKAVFRIMAEEETLRRRLSEIASREHSLGIEDEAFKRELQEAVPLAGRAVLDFHTLAATLPEEMRPLQEDRRRQIEKMKVRLEDAGLSSGDDLLKEYREASERDAFLAKELEDLEKSAVDLERLIVELSEKLDIEFKNGIQKVNIAFNSFFGLMFGGGEASLFLVREEKRKKKASDELEGIEPEEENENTPEGLDVTVSLPRKKTKGLTMLSGGERALTSIALLFAISQVNPPPFIILDETDAALDEANSRKYGDMIESLSKYSQLILITHNRETMSRAGTIFGVTMGADGASRLLSIQFEEAVKVAK